MSQYLRCGSVGSQLGHHTDGSIEGSVTSRMGFRRHHDSRLT
jgi:hypothetical protein